MYKEIHPYFHDSSAAAQNVFVSEEKRRPDKDFWSEAPARTIDLSIIRQLQPETTPDKSLELTRLNVSDDHCEDIFVSKQEGEAIRELLLRNSVDGGLAREVDILSKTIRNLYELLRARLH